MCGGADRGRSFRAGMRAEPPPLMAAPRPGTCLSQVARADDEKIKAVSSGRFSMHLREYVRGIPGTSEISQNSRNPVI